MSIIKNLYLPDRFFAVFACVVLTFCLGFVYTIFFILGQWLLLLAFMFALIDTVMLFHKSIHLACDRELPKVMSLGSENKVTLHVHALSSRKLQVRLIDEVPEQFQDRHFHIDFDLEGKQDKNIYYPLTPLTRGVYSFGDILFYLSSKIGMVERRIRIVAAVNVPVYPSIIEMKKFELRSMTRVSTFQGIKKMRRLGHSYEFEQIKNYVAGDDYRSVNWKATSRRADLMVNQYEDEKSQQVYSLIDNSRSMLMPFGGMSLLDYAINSSLVLSNVTLAKQDKAGLITFSNKTGSALKAERGQGQMRLIMETLYKQKENPLEANYELMYTGLRNVIRGRSLVFLYTNFESLPAMERVLPILRKINNLHLLVTIIFENSEISNYIKSDSRNVEQIYQQTIAEKFLAEKTQIVTKLRQYGIQTILTKPEELSVNTVNKYLELKSRGMI